MIRAAGLPYIWGGGDKNTRSPLRPNDIWTVQLSPRPSSSAEAAAGTNRGPNRPAAPSPDDNVTDLWHRLKGVAARRNQLFG